MSEDDPALLGMLDIELLSILKVACGLVEDQQANSKYDSQTIQLFNGYSCKANTVQHIKTDDADADDANSNMPDYFICHKQSSR